MRMTAAGNGGDSPASRIAGSLLRGDSTGRILGIVALVVAVLLGSAYVLGRSLVAHPHKRGAATVLTDSHGPDFADQPPGPAPVAA
ncbi:hypothetical protein ACGFI9_19400 [Micromonospora sp. NPDC048930]|uniref:hypothetical protein n=1 Tax=Micromonospora sp. NPDC048930 TaxID=3364261 RepID=UPI0037151F1F